MSNLAVDPGPSAARAGRAIGAMSFFAFGGAWLAFGLHQAMASPAGGLVAVGVLAAVLFLLAHRVYRAHAPALREAADLPSARRRRRWFHWINFGQWFLILATGDVLSRLGLSQWAIPATIGIVGLHFLPLASVLQYRPHLLTGAAFLLLAVGYPFLASGGPASSVGPMGAGLMLWLSAAWALVSPVA